MEQEDVLIAEAILGKDAKEFLASELGRYMIGRVNQEIAEASEKLSTVSPWRRRRIADLQAQIWRAKSFHGWLIELINGGEAAEASLAALDAERQ